MPRAAAATPTVLTRPLRQATGLLLAGLVAASVLGSLWYADWAGAATTTIVATSSVSPKAVSVAPGTIVTFRNDDAERHRFRTDDGAPARFDLDLDPGQSASVTLVVLGTYSYRDDRDRSNPAYVGTVTVTASSTTTTTTPPGGGGSTTTTVPAPTRAAVQVLDRSFAPPSVSVTAGSTVVWTNTSGRDHTVTADSGAFSSPTLGSGGTFQRTFSSPGTFAYFCQIHPEMRGVVTVGAAGSPPPVTTPPPPPPPTTPPPPPPPVVPGPAPGTPGAAPSSRTMQIIDFAFRPSSIDAQVGDTIVFANDGRAIHTATARGGTFDTGVIAAGARRSVRMSTAGTFSIFCTIHPAMSGTVRVVDAGGAAPAEASGGASLPGGAAGTESEPDGGSPAGERAPERGEVSVLDFSFSPPVVEVEVGAEVRWTFEGDAPHTVTSTDDLFDSGIREKGDTFSTTFDEVGLFRYVCQLHPQMTAAVKVVEPEDPTPVAATTRGRSTPGSVSQNIGFAILSAAVLLGATSLLLMAAKRFVALAD